MNALKVSISSSEIQAAIETGDDFTLNVPDDTKHVVYSGCKCYMRVIEANGIPGDPTNPLAGSWSIQDAYSGFPYFSGLGSGANATYVTQDGIYLPLPSLFHELAPLNPNGPATQYGVYTHMFYMSLATLPTNETPIIRTETKCYSYNTRKGRWEYQRSALDEFNWFSADDTSSLPGLRGFFEDFTCSLEDQEAIEGPF